MQKAKYVGKNNNVIEINGKKYNAKTGAVIGVSDNTPVKSSQTSHTQKPTPTVKKPSIDGVMRSKAHHAKAHKPHASKTLMRHAVKKPSRSIKRDLKVSGVSTSQGLTILSETSLTPVSTSTKPLTKVPKSKFIAHFAPTKVSGDIEVPTELPKITATTAAIESNKKEKTSSDILAKAIEHATPHTKKAEHHPKKKSRHTKASLAVLSVIAFGMLAFVGYQQAPSFKLQIASARAGFSASLPTYQPSGYNMQKLTYGTGVISMNFKSNSDSRSYSLTQKTSDWDSQALLDSFVKPTAANYQTVQTGGRTIFIYGNKVATWVNGGVWYTIQTDSSLTNQQIIQIAKSI